MTIFVHLSNDFVEYQCVFFLVSFRDNFHSKFHVRQKRQTVLHVDHYMVINVIKCIGLV